METFITEYAKQLEIAVREHPEEYAWPVEQVSVVVERMRQAVRLGTFNKDSRAFRVTCKILGIKHTYKAIAGFIANHQQPTTFARTKETPHMPTTEHKEQIKAECDRLAEIAAQKIGASAWYNHVTGVLTEAEGEEIHALWQTMDGNASWMNAFFYWFNGQ